MIVADPTHEHQLRVNQPMVVSIHAHPLEIGIDTVQRRRTSARLPTARFKITVLITGAENGRVFRLLENLLQFDRIDFELAAIATVETAASSKSIRSNCSRFSS